MIKAILFDMDGTLLPMDIDLFIKTYMGGLGQKVASFGMDPEPVLKALWKGTGAMVQNDGSMTNEQVFWKTFAALVGEEILEHQKDFDEFYDKGFEVTKASVTTNPQVRPIIDSLKAKGLRLIIATNPLFPAAAQYNRVKWAGLDRNDFELITTYENSHFCKPNPAYYQEILDKQGLTADEVIMIGNDAREDTAAAQIGIPVFLVTDCLLNQHGLDISAFPQGNWDDCMKYINEMISSKAANSNFVAMDNCAKAQLSVNE